MRLFDAVLEYQASPIVPRAAAPSRCLPSGAWAVLLSALVSHGASAQVPPPAPALTGGFELPAPASTECSPFNSMRAARVSGSGTLGRLDVLRDGDLAAEGTPSDGAMAARFARPDAEISVDLGWTQRLGYLVIQAEGLTGYRIEGATDGVTYQLLWTAGPSPEGGGLRTRQIALRTPIDARYLRIRGTSVNGPNAIAELQTFCSAPGQWPIPLTERPRVLSWKWIDRDIMVRIKACGALVSTLVLLGWVLARRRQRIVRCAADLLLAMCGLLAFGSWWNLGHFHFDESVHNWEHYHYYIGAKYGPELRYTRLYECTAAADLSDGRREQVVQRKMRDLAVTNQLVSTRAIVADPTRCSRHFSPERWQEFRKDIRFFRERFAPPLWNATQADHGYNATPVWAILGRLVADQGELNSHTLERNAYLDSGLLILMWLASIWAFGWRATSVALLWWGFNFPAQFSWTGGGFLRFDWLCTMLIGICLLKKRYHFAAGFLLMYSTLLRIFPGLILAALVLKLIARMVGQRRFFISRAHARLAAGCVSAALVLIPASGWAMGGLNAWPQFLENSQKHQRTALMNNMGLKTLLGYELRTAARITQRPQDPEPLREWKNIRARVHDRRKPILFVLVGLFCLLVARAGRREPDWVVACFGTGLIAISLELTCYYYGFLLTYGLLWSRSKLPGIALTALASITWLLPTVMKWHDDLFAATSLLTCSIVVASTAWFACRRSGRVLHRGAES